MMDGYEQEDTDIVSNNNNVNSFNSPTVEQIYDQLGCDALDE